ncbi:MAG: 1-(5-phosphoribosyl)-5-[(5-phosphoribosylamino)methylideneamino]imidazole-4-carboxamide isomerase [Erysipelotrichaceae bacterium]|nr:1-(5-phosphoribosyl)-5-[(5-phosphoribosylamino)methylideneamino]imidazole-4-carboxamide isomerase [Erysipelotrichaceae bacterium]
MILLPAIDLYEGKVVRLYKGDYEKRTDYAQDPVAVAMDLKEKGASHIHIVDLQGALDGQNPNFEKIAAIKKNSGLFCEVGGGIRSMKQAETYLSAGIDRIILGSAAVEDPSFLQEAVMAYREKIAVGLDLKDHKIAIHGWKKTAEHDPFDFMKTLQELGVRTLIVTDISKDGTLQGVDLDLYRYIQNNYDFDLIASGGVASLNDITALRKLGLYGIILGKAYYSGAIDLQDALKEASC